MKMIKMICPNCGAQVTMETDDEYRQFMFCQYCGNKIFLSEDKSIRIVDVAKVKSEDNKRFKLERKKIEEERNKKESDIEMKKICAFSLKIFPRIFLTFVVSMLLQNILNKFDISKFAILSTLKTISILVLFASGWALLITGMFAIGALIDKQDV